MLRVINEGHVELLVFIYALIRKLLQGFILVIHWFSFFFRAREKDLMKCVFCFHLLPQSTRLLAFPLLVDYNYQSIIIGSYLFLLSIWQHNSLYIILMCSWSETVIEFKFCSSFRDYFIYTIDPWLLFRGYRKVFPLSCLWVVRFMPRYCILWHPFPLSLSQHRDPLHRFSRGPSD